MQPQSPGAIIGQQQGQQAQQGLGLGLGGHAGGANTPGVAGAAVNHTTGGGSKGFSAGGQP